MTALRLIRDARRTKKYVSAPESARALSSHALAPVGLAARPLASPQVLALGWHATVEKLVPMIVFAPRSDVVLPYLHVGEREHNATIGCHGVRSTTR